MSNLIGSCMDLHHCSFWQIKAEDGGNPPLWSTVKLHIEWIRKPVPSPLPLSFTQRYYNFSISETAGVAQPVGVVAISQSTTPVWFNIVGKRKKNVVQNHTYALFSLSLHSLLKCFRQNNVQSNDRWSYFMFELHLKRHINENVEPSVTQRAAVTLTIFLGDE